MKMSAKIIGFIGLLIVILSVIQSIMTYKFKYPLDYEDHLGRYSEFRTLEDNTVDVIFLGTSHAMYGISPMEIYEENGIVSYNLSGSAQRIELSLHMLQMAFENQCPQVVMLDASSLFLPEFSDSAWRKALDTQPLSVRKFNLAKEYATEYTKLSISEACGLTDKINVANQKLKAGLSAVLPLYQYHTRWEELNNYDFSDVNADTYTKGYYLCATLANIYETVGTMNDKAELLYTPQTIYQEIYDDGYADYQAIEKIYRDDEVSEKSTEVLLEINQLCEDNGAELILMKVPSIGNPQTYTPSWTKRRASAVEGIANSYDITYWDIQYDTDWEWENNYSMDNGGHSNYYGAKAISHQIALYLESECDIVSEENAYYEGCVEHYDKLAAVADLSLTREFIPYLQKLLERSSASTIFFAVDGDAAAFIAEESQWLLGELGLRVTFNEAKTGASYIACLENGILKFEYASNSIVEKTFALRDDSVVTVKSIGSARLSNENTQASIVVNGTEYAGTGNGLSIVVYDNESQCVVDAARFAGKSSDNVSCAKYKVSDLLRTYQHTN